MDEEWNIYTNVERPSSHDRNSRKVLKSSECIYMNEDVIHATSLSVTSENVGSGKKKLVIGAVVLLGLLSLLLLVAIIVLVLQFSEARRNLSKERDDLQSSYSQLEKLNYNLTQNISQFEAINGNLTREKKELQTQLSKTAADICAYGISFGDSCYLFSITTKNWYDSKAECEKLAAHLVTISSEPEQKFIISKVSKQHWIGLTDEEREGTWKWVNGEPLNKKYWATHQPDNHNNNEHCVTVLSSDPLINWNDLNCQESRKWICEKEINQ